MFKALPDLIPAKLTERKKTFGLVFFPPKTKVLSLNRNRNKILPPKYLGAHRAGLNIAVSFNIVQRAFEPQKSQNQQNNV